MDGPPVIFFRDVNLNKLNLKEYNCGDNSVKRFYLRGLPSVIMGSVFPTGDNSFLSNGRAGKFGTSFSCALADSPLINNPQWEEFRQSFIHWLDNTLSERINELVRQAIPNWVGSCESMWTDGNLIGQPKMLMLYSPHQIGFMAWQNGKPQAFDAALPNGSLCCPLFGLSSLAVDAGSAKIKMSIHALHIHGPPQPIQAVDWNSLGNTMNFADIIKQ